MMINTTNVIQTSAFTSVSGNHVFLISIAIITLFTTFQSQYKNHKSVTTKANEKLFSNQKKYHILTKSNDKTEITNR